MADDPAVLLAPIRADLRTAADSGLLGVKAGDYLPAALARHSRALLAALEAALKHHQRIDRGGADLKPVCSCSRLLWPCPEVADITAALAEGEAD
jgi:hypothetical protein